MSLEKIFIVLAIILGLGSVIDGIYLLATLDFRLNELLRCSLNIIIALFVFRYFNKKRKEKAADAITDSDIAEIKTQTTPPKN